MGLLSVAVRRMSKWHVLGLAVVLLLGGCSSLRVPMNEPLRSAAGNTEYRLLDVNRGGGAESALVLVALSGGGKRSAAFAFGVLRGMRDIPVRPEATNSTLLDEIDFLAGVSGGSFPAAYFGLYGKKSFETFPDEFLYPDIEAYIWGTFLLPWNWDWVFNPLVGTNDRMTSVYDRLMLHGATFEDLYRRGRPQVSINATDISFGSPFGFLPQTFDVICSDLATLPIARAVAASNGFPVLFSPVTLRNYRGPDCPLPSPVPPQAWERAETDLRARALIENLHRYSSDQRTPWIHLMDGGVSDNLALRVLLNDVLLLDTGTDRVAAGLLPVRRILVITVDGQSAPNPNWPRQRIVSGLGQIISAVTSTQVGAYNIETLIAVEAAVDDLVAHLRALRCRQGAVIRGYACGDVAGKLLRVSLSDYPDPETRAQLTTIRTGLTLPREQVDALVAAGQTMIGRDAGTIAAFLGSPGLSNEKVAGRP
jgi:NTE family protein